MKRPEDFNQWNASTGYNVHPDVADLFFHLQGHLRGHHDYEVRGAGPVGEFTLGLEVAERGERADDGYVPALKVDVYEGRDDDRIDLTVDGLRTAITERLVAEYGTNSRDGAHWTTESIPVEDIAHMVAAIVVKMNTVDRSRF